tara:strand:+ start:288 stop:530 length:243 start_codon:yes stop_codon:yes gene_type:complete
VIKMKKAVEFRLIESEEMPPVVIKKDENTNGCIIVLNRAHTIWLSLNRSTIPGITQSLAEKLNQMCDGYLEQQLFNMGME